MVDSWETKRDTFITTKECNTNAGSNDEALLEMTQVIAGQSWVWRVREREAVVQKLRFIIRQLDRSGGDDEFVDTYTTVEDETGAYSRRAACCNIH